VPHEKTNLDRFLDAQASIIGTALTELEAGRKASHWMWFIFPQLASLGFSPTAKFYGLNNLEEANNYLQNPILKDRFERCVETIVQRKELSATYIFGEVDAKKLRSSLTLFLEASDEPEFIELLSSAVRHFFNNQKCTDTLQLIRQDSKLGSTE